ncbi:MAG: Ribosomal RNA large subunit methyltransferase E [Methanonatronarchaeales archaeon]|nr:Ribosomal RNA large subunit methyltransferase E [Methanonatronarchaeales archaeon]
MNLDRDGWYRRAKREGYRARSAYKLKQIQDRFHVIDDQDDVLDLGAAPGGWLQVARDLTDGGVVGFDLRPIEPLEDVETVRADFTRKGVLEEALGPLGGRADVVLCDASPDLSGNWSVDHARSVSLARSALSVCEEALEPGGNLVVKVFQGEGFPGFLDEVKRSFSRVNGFSPEASRKRSAEMYVVARGYVTAPVREGDVLRVEIVDTGSEGDGVARVDDFVLFVPGTDVGEELEVEVIEVRARFGFAEEL